MLFNRLGLEAGRKGKTGYSTDARVLRGLRDQHPIVPAVEEWRELTKLLNTYLEPLPARLDPVTGRLHTTFNQLVAATGRLSSSSPNLQNIPVRTDLGQEIRACFVAEEGHKLLVADYSQIELRLMASLSQEPALLEAYHRGEDVHRVTAAAVAGIPVEEVTKRQRERAKATNFGIMYGLSAFGLSEQVDIPRDEAQAFIDAYFAKYPRVKEFRERVIAQAAQDGYVTTLFGRRRAVPELRSSNFRDRSLGERLAVNTILQGTAADIIKVAMVAVSRELERRGLALAAGAAGARRARPGVPGRRARRVRAAAARRHVRRPRAGPAARGRHRAPATTGWRPRPDGRAAGRASAPPGSLDRSGAILRWFRPAAVRGPFPSVNDGPHT